MKKQKNDPLWVLRMQHEDLMLYAASMTENDINKPEILRTAENLNEKIQYLKSKRRLAV